jgi:hypothetical protein
MKGRSEFGGVELFFYLAYFLEFGKTQDLLRVCKIVLGKSCVLPTSKKIC